MASRRRTYRARRFCAALAAAACTAGAAAFLFPALLQGARQAALAAMVFAMPEGGVSLLEKRFFSETFSEEEAGPEDPYVQPAPPPGDPGPEEEPREEEETEPEDSGPPLESIAPENRGTITEQQFTSGEGAYYVPLPAGCVKNSTELANEEVEAELEKPLGLAWEDTEEPQVLIFHTHATESYEPYDREFCDTSYNWRSTDNDNNMAAVGEVLARELRAAGIGVIHDVTQHDYPSYNGSYQRSAETVSAYLEKYPSIQVVLDIHRDAIESPAGNLIKPVAWIDGKKAAQVMIISGCDDGTMNMPGWADNLRFAAALQSEAESRYPGLMRPVFFCYRKYNMDLSPGALLLEVGSHGNTLEEASYSAELLGKALAAALEDPGEQEKKK
jgi:stage II sporulation protein P